MLLINQFTFSMAIINIVLNNHNLLSTDLGSQSTNKTKINLNPEIVPFSGDIDSYNKTRFSL